MALIQDTSWDRLETKSQCLSGLISFFPNSSVHLNLIQVNGLNVFDICRSAKIDRLNNIFMISTAADLAAALVKDFTPGVRKQCGGVLRDAKHG